MFNPPLTAGSQLSDTFSGYDRSARWLYPDDCSSSRHGFPRGRYSYAHTYQWTGCGARGSYAHTYQWDSYAAYAGDARGLRSAHGNRHRNPGALESGVFRVGTDGRVKVDYLFDGGAYHGEVAIFSLEGMEGLRPGTQAFAREAVARSLSNSALGHVVISDRTEGAKLTGELGERSWNDGPYSGVKTIQMRPGDKVGFMLVPDGTVKSSPYRNYGRKYGGSQTPFFSFASGNPGCTTQFTQVVDGVFAWEDLWLLGRSDRDYNDVIFSVDGLVGTGAKFGDVVSRRQDWRDLNLGQEIIKAVLCPEPEPKPEPEPDRTAPVMTASLFRDTAPGGRTNTDRITSIPTISGSLTDASPIVEFRAGFGSLAESSYANVLPARQADGSFTLDRAQLEQVYGGGLQDGVYTLHLRAKDQFNNAASVDITFTLDTTTPTPIVDLLPASDSGVSDSDNVTRDNTPTIAGTAESGATVQLLSNGTVIHQTTSTGTWEFTAPLWADGVYVVRAIATDIAGNESLPSVPLTITIDTALPQLALSTPVDSRPLTVGARLTGQANGTGSAVVAMSYRFDELAEIPVLFDANGAFDQVLNLTSLRPGNHTLMISMTDQAGNVATNSFVVAIASPEPALILREGQSFEVNLDRTLTTLQQPSVLSFTFDAQFDVTDLDSMKDAFEVALVDAAGESLVQRIEVRRDAFFNVTEGLAAALGTGTRLNGQTVSLDLPALPVGQSAKLIFRLVNNDQDTKTVVTITDLQVQAGGSGVGSATPLVARTYNATTPDFAHLTDVSPSLTAKYGRTSLNAATQVLYSSVGIQNQGTYAVRGPLLVVVKNLSDPGVRVVDADGVTPEGLPYYDFTSLLNNQVLDARQESQARNIAFFNPQGIQFTYDLEFLADMNTAPVIQSRPNLEAISGLPYRYDVEATDADQDVLRYRLSVAPVGMTIDPVSGLIQWNPITTDVGSRSVVVTVVDGHGGESVQAYNLSVITTPPNRPPIFTTTPVVDAQINQPYRYDSDAVDPDQDPLQYRLVLGPEGMQVDPLTGLVQWTPPSVLTLGDTVLGQISLPGNLATFTLSGVTGQRLYLDRLQEFTGQQIRIYNPSGNLIDPGNGLFTLTETGNYRVVVDGSGDRAGRYGFSLIDPALLPETPLDQVISGQLSPGSEDDLFRFNGFAGQKLFFDKLSNQGSLDWVLLDPSNQIIVQESSMNDMEIDLPIDGEYILVLRGKGEFTSSVNYSFSVVTPEVVTRSIDLNRVVSGTIGEKGEQDSFTFTGKAGQQLFYDALGGNPLDIVLSDPTGKVVYSAPQWVGGNTNDRGPDNGMTLSMDGVYRLTIDGPGESLGNYSFRLLDLATAPVVAMDTDIAGTLDNSLGSTAYRFTVSEKQYLYVDSLQGDAGWLIYGPDGRLINTARLNEDREFEINAGDYLLVIQGFGSNPTYKVRLITPELTTTSIQMGQIVSGSLVEKGEQDSFTFTGKAGQQLFYDALGGNPLDIVLSDPTGKVVYSAPQWVGGNTNDRGPDNGMTLSMDGVYRLTIDGPGESLGNYSFRLLDRATAPVVALDTDIAGTLDNSLGSTAYRFTVSEKQYLYVDSLQGDAGWLIYGPDGRLINTALLNEDREFEINAGDYLLVIQGFGSNPTYKMRLITPELTTTSIQMGQIVSGSLVEKGEQDSFTFTGKAGQQLFYDALGGDPLGISLYDPTGKAIYSGWQWWGITADSRSDRGPDIGLVLLVDGTYRLTIDGYREGIGNYNFRLLDRATAPVVALDTDIVGSLDNPLGSTLYRFNLTDHRSVYVDGIAGNGAWSIFGPEGRFIRSAELSSDAEIQLYPGDYLLAIQGNGSSSNYRVQIKTLSPWIPPTSNDAVLSFGSIVNGTISQPGEQKGYTFTGKAGQQLFYDGLGGDPVAIPLAVSLYDPTGRSNAVYVPNSLSDAGPNDVLSLSMDGTYRLMVGGAGGSLGNYRFRLLDLDTAPLVALDTDITGTLDNPFGSTAYRFTVSEKQYLYVDSLEGNGDRKIYDAGGNYLNGDGLNQDWEVELNAGEYLLVLQGSGSASNYKMRLITPELTTASIQVGQIVSGTIGEKGEQDSFTFTGKAGQQLFYDALGGNPFGISLYDPTGKAIYSGLRQGGIAIDSRNDRGPDGGLVLSMDGTYRLTIDGPGESLGNYSFRLLDRETAPVVALDTDIVGTLDNPLGSTAYRFTIPAKQYLYVDGLAGDGSWIIYGPDGRYISSSQLNGDQEFELHAGEYLLVMQGNGSSPNYKMQLITPELTTASIQVGQIVSGTIGEKGEQDSFTFTGKAGQQLFYDALGGNPSGISLYDPTGRAIYSGLNYWGIVTDSRNDRGPDGGLVLSMDGTYRLTIDGYREDIGNYSFRLLDRATAPVVALDTDIVGTLDNPLGSTAYRFTIPAKQYLYVDGLAGDGSWIIYGPDGRSINTARLNGDQEFELNAGEYLLVMQGNGSSPNYKVRLITPELTTTSIQVGQIVSGTIGEKGEQDSFTFTGKVGQQLFYDALGGDPFGISLYDPAGRAIYSGFQWWGGIGTDSRNDRGPDGGLVLSMDGTYRLTIDGPGESLGNYSFRLLDRATAPVVALDTDIAGTLDNPLGSTAYRFTIPAKQYLYVDGLAGDGSWIIYGPDGRSINTARFNEDREFELNAGEYLLVMQGNGSSPNYKMRLITPELTTASLQLGQTVSGSLVEQGEQDSFTFAGTVGQRFFLDAIAASGNLHAKLYGPGNNLISDRDLTSDWPPLTLTDKGTYRLVIDGNGPATGTYRFILNDLNQSPLLSTGTPVTGSLEPGNSVGLYRLNGTQGTTLRFDLTAAQWSGANWVLYDPGNQVIATPPSGNPDFQVTLPSTGSYILAIQGSSSTPINYTFQVTNITAAPVPNQGLNTLYSGTFVGGVINHPFSATAGTQVYFDGQTTSGANVLVRLLNPDGSAVFSDQDTRFNRSPITLSQTGNYTLQVFGGTGNYAFKLLELPQSLRGPGVNYLELGGVVSGTLAGAESKVYTFEGLTGLPFYFNGIEGNDISATLYGPNGAVVFGVGSSRDNTGLMSLTQDGRYQLVLANQSTAPRTYRFQPVEFLNGSEIALNLPVSGSLRSGQETQFYKLKGEAGQTLFFDALQGSDRNRWLLFGPGNAFLGGTGLNQDFEVNLTATGEYILLIEGSEDSNPVNYQFRVLAYDQPVADIITPGTGESTGVDGTLAAEFAVKLQATDGRGGQTLQNYTIRVGPDPTNGNPAIISTPLNRFARDTGVYRYQVKTLDPDQDPLRYRLLEGPLGALIDKDSGELLWVPETNIAAGSQVTFAVQVTDGRGGFDTQRFTVDVFNSLGTIQGAVFDDLNGNGVMDTQLLKGDKPSLVLALDVSGSTIAPFRGNRAYPGIKTVLDAEVAASLTLIDALIAQGLGNTVQVGLIPHRDLAILQDMDPVTPGVQAYTTPLADRDNNGISDIRDVLASYRPMGGNSFTKTLDSIQQLVQALPGNPNVIFMSDGYDSSFERDPAAGLRVLADMKATGVNFNAFAIGEASTLSTIQQLDSDAERLVDIAKLVSVFSGFDPRYAIEPLKNNVTVYLDLNNNGVLDSTEPSQLTQPLASLEAGAYPFSFDNLLPGTYTIRQVSPTGYRQTAPVTDPLIDIVTVAGETLSHLFGLHQNSAPPPNSDPIFRTLPSPTTLGNGQSFLYQANAIDPDADPLTYDLILNPAGMLVDPGTGVVTWEPTAAQVEHYYADLRATQARLTALGRGSAAPQRVEFNVLLRVRDQRGGQALQSIVLDLLSPNSAPVFTSDPTQAIAPQIGKPFEYRATALDADNDPLTYGLLTTAPLGMTLNAQTGTLSWTPTTTQLGSQKITLTASDGKGGTALQQLNLTVVPSHLNTAPIITSEPRTTIRPGTPYLYQLAVTDLDGDPLSFQLTTAPTGMTVDQQGRLSWLPELTQTGNHSVSVVVSDGQGGNTTQSFSLQVRNVAGNSAPTISSQPPTLTNLDRLYQYALTATDPDGDALIWSLTQPPKGMVIHPQTGVLSWQPTSAQVGTHPISVQVTDSLGATTTQTFSLQVRSINTPPQISSTPLTQIGASQTYRYQVEATDPEGDSVRFSLASRPDGMTIDSTTGLVQWQPIASQIGNQTVTIQATDVQGAITQQTYTLVVGATAINQAPNITSQPGLWADPTTGYRYAIAATDPEGDRPTFSLIKGPAGMTVDASTGVVQWTPAIAQVGNQAVSVAAFDSQGLGAVQSYTLTVTPGNAVPVIRSTPTQEIAARSPYRYDVWAVEPDGEPLQFALTQAPDGMTIDAAGRISWLPGAGVVGTYPVTVTVSDGRGAQAIQSFNLSVVPDTQAPKVTLKLGNPQVKVGEVATLLISATDNVGVAGLTLTIDGTPVAVDASGRATLPITRGGSFNAIASAVDAAGNVGSATVPFAATDPRDTAAPFVNFTSLTGGEVIQARTTVQGTVTDDNLLFYTLSVAPVAGGSFTEIGRGTTTVTNGPLGQFDPSVLLNDSYILRLSATDANGKTSTVDTQVNVAGELKVGNFQLSFNDLSVPVSGLPIQVTRTYDTFNSGTTDDFGYGWRLEFRDTDLRTSLGRDLELEELGVSSKGFKEGTRVYITLPGGKREGFTFKPQVRPISRFLGSSPLYTPAFVADAGNTSTLTVQTTSLIRSETGEFISPNGGRYNPANAGYGFGGYYELTTKEGIAYRIDGMTGDLDTVRDRNGNTLTFTDSSITSSTGQVVTFERDAQNRITAVVDPLGKKVTYQYDALGDLVSVTDRQGNITQFDYNDTRAHYLDKVIDPLGHVGVRSEYDAQGRLIKLLDATGKPVELIHDPANSVEGVKDQLGNTTTYEYDSRGNVVTEVNALGGITRRTYDADNNTLAETDPLGNTTRYTYDSQGNQLTMTDPLGRVTRYTYDTFGNVLTTTDPSGQTTTNRYDARGNLLSISGQANGTMNLAYDAAGNLTRLTDGSGTTTFEYDGRGNVVREVNALGQVKTYTYDGNGNQLTQTQTLTTATGVRSLVTRKEYDAQGRAIRVTDPEGGVTQTVYNQAGQRIQSIDALGRVTKFVYDDRGQLTETIYPDSTPATDADNPRTRTEYDAAGRTIASVDELGRRTVMEYDALGRQVATIYPDNTPGDNSDNPRTRTEYDAAGRAISQIDPRGNRTEYVYNSAGQVVETILPDDTPLTLLDNPRFRSTYDAAGRQMAQTDALGQITTFLYDDLGRPTGQVFTDGTRSVTQYDAAGRVTARIDQAGRATAYEYDALGRLTAVVDALGQRTAYRYNELGNLISQTDANGNATRYDYDGLGRRISTDLPLGQRSTSTYDSVGHLLSTTDFNGQTIGYSYDVRDLLTAKTFPDQTGVQYTYTPTGLPASVTDSRGVTTYSYDAQDRLLQRTDPDGRSISYTYDAAGNRTSVIIPSGNTIYTYDAQNRLKTVLDPDNGRTNYFYDLNGRLVRTELPNGTTETREYDNLNRLTFLENRGPGGVINSFRYTLDATGNRTAVVENDGRRVEYSYDVLYRLTAERIFDPGAAAPTRVMEYAYDAVGNRLSRRDTGEGTTLYLYDRNDRLLTTTLNGAGTTYAYDNNGNTLSRTGPTGQVAYQWDVENRLVGADTNGDGVIDVRNQYNANGIRVAQVVNGAETRFLIDENQRYAQVLEEYTPGGVIQVSYVYGNDLISQERGTERSFYHVDGLGSTRTLTNEAGILTDRYLYDVGGRLIEKTGTSENWYRFSGEQSDPILGLDYLRARYLNIDQGRFYGRDAFEGAFIEPITLNKYLYANANPAIYVDPNGNFASALLTIAEVVGIMVIAPIFNSFYALSEFGNEGDTEGDFIIYSGYGNAPAFGLMDINSPISTHHFFVGGMKKGTDQVETWELGPAGIDLGGSPLLNIVTIGLYPAAWSQIDFNTRSLRELQAGNYLSEELRLNEVQYNAWKLQNQIARNYVYPYSFGGFTCQNWASDAISRARSLDKVTNRIGLLKAIFGGEAYRNIA